MLRNCLAASLGNITRNGLYAAITILGLAVSFAAAILIGLYVRDEYSLDHFVRAHENVYRVKLDLTLPGQKPRTLEVTQSSTAGLLKLDFPEVQQAARLYTATSPMKSGEWSANVAVNWVDPDFFKILTFPALVGDLDTALEHPDGLVLTRSAARRFFGTERPIGRVIQVMSGAEQHIGVGPEERAAVAGFHPMRVAAVIDDLPASSHLTAEVFASALAPFSPTSVEDRHPIAISQNALTYVRLKPGSTPEAWSDRLAAFADHRYRDPSGRTRLRYWLARLDELHFMPTGTGPSSILRPSADPRVDLAIAAVGGLIVLIAAINFITLMTARAARRAVEVGVRKATGARRRHLVAQFMGEALIYVVLAMVVGVVAAEISLPAVNGFLQRNLRFDYLADPMLAGALAAGALLTALLAGIYPALVLSSFRPAQVLKGGLTRSTGSVSVRQGLVVAQFAILIGLIVMTATLYRQTKFVLNDALRVDTDQVIRMPGPCNSPYERGARSVAGVQAVACASPPALGLGTNQTTVTMPDRSQRAVYFTQIGVGFLELEGLKPAAGRFFSRTRGEDVILERPGASADLQPSVVLNESAVRFLGFASPGAAVGKTVTWGRRTGLAEPVAEPSVVVGVTPDFTLSSVRNAVQPTIYYVDPVLAPFLVAKLDPQRTPEALDGLRRLWRRVGRPGDPNLVFQSQSVQALYQDVIIQGVALGVCAGLAILIACLGLFALAAFVTEQRVKEIGVRKAMGASSGDVVKLLLWQFTQPVLWANLVAWPAAFFAMNYWLHGFAYRVGQPAWLYLAASLIGAAIAWATVCFQSLRAARSKPALALRYE